MVRCRVIVVGLGLVAASAASACAAKEDVTPTIAISPGAKARIVVMDRYRHQGAPRRWLPHVTVEEAEEEDVDAGAGAGGEASEEQAESDAKTE